MESIKKTTIVFISAIMIAVLMLCSCGGYEKGTDDYRKDDESIESSSMTSDEASLDMNKKIQAIQKLIDENYLDYNENGVDIEKAYQDAVKGYVSSLGDKYSEYFPPELNTAVQEGLDGSFVGIGVYAGFDAELKRVVISKVIEEGPAEEAGIKDGDIVMKIDGEDVYEVPLDDVVSKMKGVEGTRVTMTVKRDEEELDIDIIRRKIENPTVFSEMLDENIGYIYISAFDTVTVNQFSKAIESLLESGMTGLVIDVRNNGGGNLYSVSEMCDRLLDKDLIVLYTIDSKGNREDTKTKKEDKLDIPVTVLINERTASAAEVFAGCLKVHMNACLIGSKSFGKGIMQQLYPLEDGSYLKLTVAKWYMPDDNNVQGNGLEPDIAVEQAADSQDDDVVVKAMEYLKGLQ